MILMLKDGSINEIYSDHHYRSGSCETCDYGSEYASIYRIDLNSGSIHIEATDEHQYPINEGFMLGLFLNHVDVIKNATEQSFYEWLEENLDKEFGENIDITFKTTENT